MYEATDTPDYAWKIRILEGAKDEPYDENQSYGDIFLEDLQALEDEGITHPDVKKIRKLLEE